MRYLSVVTASMFGTLIALFAVCMFFIFFVFVMAAGTSATPPVRSQSTLVVPVAGSLAETVSGDPLSQSLLGESSYGLHDVTEALRRAADDDRIRAVWVKTGLTSMSWASLQAVRRALVQLSDSGKPVYASSSSYYMTEKEFYVASVADSIFLNPESVFELNGFYASATFFGDMLDRLHIEPQIVRAGSYKSAIEPFTRENMSDESREQTRALLTDVESEFLSSVAESRNLDRETFRTNFTSEAVLTADRALERGYIDGLYYDGQIRELLARRTGVDDAGDLRELSLRAYAQNARTVRSGSSGEVAVVYAVGTMIAGEEATVPNPLFGGGMLGSESFRKSIRRAVDNSRTRAIVVRINSPGGQASAADAMLQEIQAAADSLPVVVSMGDVAASGGYWIAVGAPTIVAEPLTLTGSIGVFSLFFDVSGLLDEHLGITNDIVATGPYADMLSGLRPYRPEEARLMETYTNDTYTRFIELVAEGRDMSPDSVRLFAEGRVWTGVSALSRGLVDVLGGLETAISLAAEQADLDPNAVRIREYPAPRTFFERFMSQTRLALGRLGILSWETAVPGNLDRTVAAVKSLLDVHGSVQARMPFEFDTR